MYPHGLNRTEFNQEAALELHSRAAPSVEAHHLVDSPDTGAIPEEGEQQKYFLIPFILL